MKLTSARTNRTWSTKDPEKRTAFDKSKAVSHRGWGGVDEKKAVVKGLKSQAEALVNVVYLEGEL